MSNSKFAKAYAAYTSGWLGRSIYHAWFMFFADIILSQDGDRIELVQLRDAFDKKYGIHVPMDFVKKTLQICGTECISLDGKQVAVVDKMKLQAQSKPDSGYQKQWASLRNDFSQYCSVNGVDHQNNIDELILDCIEQYDVEVVSTAASDVTVADGKVEYAWNKYVQNLYASKPGLYEFVCRLCYGSIAKDAMLRTDGTGLVFKGLSIYLDTPLVFQLLGMSEKEECESARYLFSSLRASGCSVKVFGHTIEEVESIAYSAKRWALDLTGYDARRASKTARFFREQRLTSQQIDELICNIEGELTTQYGVVVDDVTYEGVKYAYQIDEKKLKQMFDDRYKSADPYRVDDIERGIRADIRSIAMLYHHRGRCKPKNFNQCRVLMLTSSKTMASVCKDFQREMGSRVVPVCLSSKIVASMLWAASPKELVEYKKLEIIADCARFLKPSDVVLRKFFDRLPMIDASDIAMREKYFMLTASPMMEHALMDAVKGDENAITDNTIDEVYDRICRKESEVRMRNIDAERTEERRLRAERRHAKFRQTAHPLTCCIWMALWALVIIASAICSYLLHKYLPADQWIAYSMMFVVDSVVLGGDIHERWIRRSAAVCACKIFRSLMRRFSL